MRRACALGLIVTLLYFPLPVFSQPTNVTGGASLVTIEFRDTDIRAALRTLAELAHRNLVVTSGVAGRVTIRLRDVPLDEAIEHVARAKGARVTRDRNVLFVSPLVE